ncbi:hypothetical protein A0130_03180 [Leifsonia xyli]|uniref:sigma factor-like helix-turn-helix DNA-binding protein n=1 Tax=Leifsonia xyli TaxID=1575 RepID=UPI0007CDF59B|nr:hypothetical protein A0130_03180 [Leifsonia xyli]
MQALLKAAGGDADRARELAKLDKEVSPETFDAALKALRPVESLFAEDADGNLIHDYAVDADGDTPVSAIEDRLLAEYALAALTSEEKMVVRLMYGFGGFNPAVPEEVAATLGIDKRTVDKTHAAALTKMRRALGAFNPTVDDAPDADSEDPLAPRTDLEAELVKLAASFDVDPGPAVYTLRDLQRRSAKSCTSCGRRLDLSAFGTASSRPLAVDSQCLECRSQAARDRRAA